MSSDVVDAFPPSGSLYFVLLQVCDGMMTLSEQASDGSLLLMRLIGRPDAPGGSSSIDWVWEAHFELCANKSRPV